MPSEEYIRFHADLRAEYQPATALQEFAVEQAAHCARELQRMNLEFGKCQMEYFDREKQPDMYTWSAAQFAVYDRMLRYRVQAERSFERAWKGVERIRAIHLKAQYREFWEKLQNNRLELAKQRLQLFTERAQRSATPKEKPKPKDTRSVAGWNAPVIHLVQTIVVELQDGVISHVVHPLIADMHISAAFLEPEGGVIRRFEFPDGIPSEYAWVNEPDISHRDGGMNWAQFFENADQWRAHVAMEEGAGSAYYLPKTKNL